MKRLFNYRIERLLRNLPKIVLCSTLVFSCICHVFLPSFYNIRNTTDLENLFPNDVDAVTRLVDDARLVAEKVRTIIQCPVDNQTYATTFGYFDAIKNELSTYRQILDVVANSNTKKEVRDAANKAVVEINNLLLANISLNKPLFETLKTYAEHHVQNKSLSKEHQYFIQVTLQKFVCSGLNLETDKLERVQALSKEINEFGQEFQKRINDYNTIIVLPADQLAGTPAHIINSLTKRENGDCIIPACTSIITSILENCTIQNTRKLAFDLWINEAYPDNVQLLNDIINKRDELAHLIGFESYAAMELSTHMAKSVETVETFITGLAKIAVVKAKKQIKQFSDFYPSPEKLTNEKGEIFPWDIRFLINYYKKNNFAADMSHVSEYFTLDNTINAMLDICQQFFEFTCLRKKFTRWHEDTEVVEIYKNGEIIGYVILDLFPRPNKYNGGASFPTVRSLKSNGKRYPSINVLMMNFPKSGTEQPTLLEINDVSTLFHEFGHALHGVLGATNVASLSGAQVPKDFLEMPSQLLEMWLTDSEILKRISRHHKTGQPLPDKMITAIGLERNFGAAYYIGRQLRFATMSLNYFKNGQNKNIQRIMSDSQRTMVPYLAPHDNDHEAYAFSHLVEYGSTYYGYMWANVFVKDVFEKIKIGGLLNPHVGQELVDKILGIGGGQDPNELLESFLGRKSNQTAFIKFMGLLD